MTREPVAHRRSSWLPWFCVAVAALAASLGFLAFVLFDTISDGQTGDRVAPLAGATTASEVREGLTFAGPLPHGGAALGLKAVEAGKDKEYTDWSALGAVLDGWAAGVTPRIKAGAASAG